jgi:hypothetical protein
MPAETFEQHLANVNQAREDGVLPEHRAIGARHGWLAGDPEITRFPR